MDQSLVDSMWEYLNAGLTMDIDKIDALYDPEFENIRIDEAGLIVALTKAQFMDRFHALKAQGQHMEPVDDVEFLTTTRYGDHATIIMRRVKEGRPVLYNFVWRMDGDRPATILREFTNEKDLSYLVKLIAAAG
ncbi:MAG: hypothetical protein HOV96_41450 [Nonomuraea sp.]|nr:hypothetical protein [Nonomuraea sp.]NUP63690.1 hypothetical protein [Nonomuraea sp.]NUP84013.1 hypothetical protein [Nonomuraea sp.]NUS01575.1 hypothetical protein [Nonomuraea sp.]